MNLPRSMVALFAGLSAIPAAAQNCAAPIEITTQLNFSGNTCDGTVNLPFLANGAIVNQGEDDVYHLAITGGAAAIYDGTVELTPATDTDLSLFICRGPCGTYSTCIAAMDNGTGALNSATIPAGVGEYYIIVGHSASSAPTCGSYTLNLIYPLND